MSGGTPTRVAKARETWSGLNRYPFFRALVRQAGIALWATGAVWAFAWGTGTGISGFEILAVHILLTAYLTADVPAPPDPDGEAAALAAFGETALGALVGGAKGQLTDARRRIGREAVMHGPLDRLVVATRRIEKRLATEPRLRPALNRIVTRELPLVASTAGQYVAMQGRSGVAPERLVTIEGILRDAAERFDTLGKVEAGPEGALIGLARLDADAEVLADYMATDLDAARGRAEVLRIAHRLDRAAPRVVPELEYKIRTVAELLQAHADHPEAQALIAEKGMQVAEIAEVADMDTGGRAALRVALEDWRGALNGLSNVKGLR